MKTDNISTSQSFKSIKYLSAPSFTPNYKIFGKLEQKNVDPEFKKVIENAPLLKKLGEKSDVFVCHYKVKNSNMHVLSVDVLDDEVSDSFGEGEFYHENIRLSRGSNSDEGFYKHIENVFAVLVDNFKKFKSDNYIDTIFIKKPEQVLIITHHGHVKMY